MRTFFLCSYLNNWRDFAPMVLRVVTGLIFAMHGWQKLNDFGVAGVTGMLAGMGFPMPALMAILLIAAELVGGIMLILGFLTRWAAKSLVIVSAIALFVVHLPNGFFASTGGYEFILLLLGASVSLVLSGPGTWSLDRIVWKG